MKMFLFLTVAMMSITAICSTLDPREWTSVKGDKISATFVSEKSGTVTLKTADGKTMSIKMAALSDQDKQWISDASYIPKKWELLETSHDKPILRTSAMKKTRACIRDSIIVTVKDDPREQFYRITEITDISVKELGSSLKNKEGKTITTEGRFLSVHWSVKNLSKSEYDANFPDIGDDKKTWYKAKELDDHYLLSGTHCNGLDKESRYVTVQPQFSVKFCNIFEIPKDFNVLQIRFYELGNRPCYFFVSTKIDYEYDKLTTWQKQQKEME